MSAVKMTPCVRKGLTASTHQETTSATVSSPLHLLPRGGHVTAMWWSCDCHATVINLVPTDIQSPSHPQLVTSPVRKLAQARGQPSVLTVVMGMRKMKQVFVKVSMMTEVTLEAIKLLWYHFLHQTRMNARKTPLCAARAHTVRIHQGSTSVKVPKSRKVSGGKQLSFLGGSQNHLSS